MGFRKNCVWFDETKNKELQLCCYTSGTYCRYISECPKNCRNYINKFMRDEDLRKAILGKIVDAAAE